MSVCRGRVASAETGSRSTVNVTARPVTAHRRPGDAALSPPRRFMFAPTNTSTSTVRHRQTSWTSLFFLISSRRDLWLRLHSLQRRLHLGLGLALRVRRRVRRVRRRRRRRVRRRPVWALECCS